MKAIIAVLFLTVISTVSAFGHEIDITIYDDGHSCPGGCDAHVVMHNSVNGTIHAYSVASSRTAPAKCVNGRECTICFSHEPDSCLVTTYRGSGPPKTKFDFTPAFFRDYCGRTNIPNQLRTYCSQMERNVKRLGYDARVNCFKNSTDTACKTIMSNALDAQSRDGMEREKCLRLGETAYNASQPDKNMHRTFNCDYSRLSLGGPNSSGVRWKKLLPGACRPGTHVGRDGFDCCTADEKFAANIHPECSAFYPRR